MSAALADFRILDLSDSIAGQFGCRMMADFGAEVTLVEPPSGSPIRHMPPFDPSGEGAASLLFFHLNLGKRSIVLDRNTEAGRARLLDLVKSVDAVVVGLDADRDALRRANPQCVVTLVSDFGDDGPYRHWRGSEMIFQALSGMMYVNGSGDREPLYGVGHRAQYAAGVGVYIATLAALYARKVTLQGQQVALDVAMNTSSMAPPATVEYAYSKMQDPRGERRSPFMVVRCRDGFVSIWVHLHVWPGFCKAAGIGELEHDPRFAKGKERQDNWTALTAAVQERVADLSGDEFLDRLLKERIAAAKAYTPRQLWNGTPHLIERNYWQSVATPSGPRPILGPPFRLSRTPRDVRNGAPRLGEHDAQAVDAARRPGAANEQAAPMTSRGPLAGLRVLDFTTAWAGPMTGRILAFLGAEVIKVESASRPDTWRMHNAVLQAKRYPGGEPGERPYNRVALFNSQNHNKLGLSLDIKHSKGLAAMHRLAATADVAICNFTAGTLARMGVGYEALKKIKSDIIVLEMPGFGNTGPLSKAAANGATMEMAAGMCAMIGYAGGAPTTTGQVYPDPIGGYNGAAAVMTALMHRQATGEGQYIELSQVEAAMQFIGEELLYAIAAEKDPELHGNRVRWAAPHDAYPAEGNDEWVAIAIGDDEEWRRFCTIIDRPELAGDARFSTFKARWEHQELLREPISQWSRQHAKATIADALQAQGIRAAPVNAPRDVTESPYLAAREAFVTLTHPDAGTHPYMTLPFRLSLTPGSQHRASPCLGADTRKVLLDLAGLTVDELDELDREGVTCNVPAA
ncbi:CoA transferase [Bradyrhizobium sp. LHD-71]|uniref:CaiB/BaiF CoA transferase family protein n=1 Tax=Bradyrhizobium sp. LHD-71 TaxID=3072141 RepID=UPI00280EC651|nr:CoA transferase [Bradyrhizobium sp. LHD-71]MDQ8732735.1 CoA transferase [Bradyrhizobium sp. LHD-71]